MFGIQSLDKLFAGGRRAWHSYARVNSDFHLTGFINANSSDGTPRHCCTPKVGFWIVGSCDGPVSTENLKRIVAGLLYTAGMNISPIGVPFEFGWQSDKSFIADCNKVIVNDGNGQGTGDRSSNLTDFSGVESLRVFDLSGRLIGSIQANEVLDMASIQNLIDERFNITVEGVYLLQIVKNGESITRKILIK